MIRTFSLLLLYQLGGEVFVRLLGLPIPGAVAGMTFLFLTLLGRGRVGQETRQNVGALLKHLSLLFVPAGVGVMVHLQRVANEWLPITVALILSTFAGMAATAWTIRALLPKETERTKGERT